MAGTALMEKISTLIQVGQYKRSFHKHAVDIYENILEM